MIIDKIDLNDERKYIFCHINATNRHIIIIIKKDLVITKHISKDQIIMYYINYISSHDTVELLTRIIVVPDFFF